MEVAGDVAPVVVIVRVEVAAAAPGVTTGGTKSQLVPGGRPDEQVNVAELLTPSIALTETVNIAVLPAVTEPLLGGNTLTPKS